RAARRAGEIPAEGIERAVRTLRDLDHARLRHIRRLGFDHLIEQGGGTPAVASRAADVDHRDQRAREIREQPHPDGLRGTTGVVFGLLGLVPDPPEGSQAADLLTVGLALLTIDGDAVTNHDDRGPQTVQPGTEFVLTVFCARITALLAPT